MTTWPILLPDVPDPIWPTDLPDLPDQPDLPDLPDYLAYLTYMTYLSTWLPVYLTYLTYLTTWPTWPTWGWGAWWLRWLHSWGSLPSHSDSSPATREVLLLPGCLAYFRLFLVVPFYPSRLLPVISRSSIWSFSDFWFISFTSSLFLLLDPCHNIFLGEYVICNMYMYICICIWICNYRNLNAYSHYILWKKV